MTEAFLVDFAALCRVGLEGMTPAERGYDFDTFPRGCCGPVAELAGRLFVDIAGIEGVYVVGDGHPDLKATQSHAWLEASGYIVDLTHDQFQGTGLVGWVFPADSSWHGQFDCERKALCLKPEQWAAYPWKAYAAMIRATAPLRVSS